MSRFCGPVSVLYNRRLSQGYYEMGLAGEAVANLARPGQFVMVRIDGAPSPFLRRPFSIHRTFMEKSRAGFSLVYKVVGDLTRRLSLLNPRDRLEVLGPLGNHFNPGQHAAAFWLAAGGVGVAPLVFLADYLMEKGMDPANIRLYFGGAAKKDLVCRAAFRDAGMEVVLTTEDGSAGITGQVTGPLEKDLAASPPDGIFACGPLGMLRAVADLAEKAGVFCQVSIETLMACGMGACLGCAVQSRTNPETYVHACTNGPVFDAVSIVL